LIKIVIEDDDMLKKTNSKCFFYVLYKKNLKYLMMM